MTNIINMFPANNFSVMCESASKEIVVGLIIGYDEEGYMKVFGGGLVDGKVPVQMDWLWLVENFKNNLINGVYVEEE